MYERRDAIEKLLARLEMAEEALDALETLQASMAALGHAPSALDAKTARHAVLLAFRGAGIETREDLRALILALHELEDGAAR